MQTVHKFLSIFSLVTILSLTLATPALAFDGRGGEDIVIKADEVIDDDLYVGANTFVLDGTVKGDLIVFAQSITINGTVEGDLIAAGQSVVINGTINDDARIAGAGLQLGEKASIGGDLVSAGASLEAKNGSAIGNELVFAGQQALLAGTVSNDVLAATPALEMRGSFGGDVKAYVDVTGETKSSPPMQMWMSDMPISIPSIGAGLTIAKGAKIDGDLEYTSTVDLPVPSGVVAGTVTRTEPEISREEAEAQPTPAQVALIWSLNLLREIITLVVFSLLLAWLLPAFIKNLMYNLQIKPAASLGWGIVALAAFCFALIVVFVALLFGGILFHVLTLGGIGSTIVWLGILVMFAMIVAFVLVASFLTKIIVAWTGGKWILGRLNPALAEHKVWPLVLGVIIVALLLAIPYLGALIGWIVFFLGLGAMWFWGRDLWQARKTA